MSYDVTLRRHRRLTILRTLDSVPGYSANESIIEAMLDRFRVPSTRDQVRTELTWLRDQGLLEIDDVTPDFMVATITKGGTEIANGKRYHPDIEKPAAKRA